MNWHYASGGKPVGPISETDFDNLIRTGVIQADTLVWREGMTDWVAWGKLPAPSAAGEPVPTPASPTGGDAGNVCVECARTFPDDQVIRYGTVTVCHGCRPAYLGKLRASISSASPGGTGSREDLLTGDYQTDIATYLGRAWEIFRSDIGGMVLVTLVFGLLVLVINIIPYLNFLLTIFFTGPLTGGYWLFFIRKTRGEETSINDAFGGIGNRFWQLMLAHLVPGILAGLCLFAIVIPLAVIVPSFVAAMSRAGQNVPSIPPLLIAVVVPFVLLGFSAFVYLSVNWMFTIPLVKDKGLDFSSAMKLSRGMVKKHWWQTLGLAIVCGALNFAGLLFCGVGLLVTGPLSMTMMALHYDKVFGGLENAPG
jgi:hypothetical protein